MSRLFTSHFPGTRAASAKKRVKASSIQTRSELKTPSTHFSFTGCTKAPFPAESQTANRIQVFPDVSNGILKWCLPNAGISVSGIICRSIFTPSPQTTSANSSGNVHSTSAVIVLFSPLPSTEYVGISTSPEVTKNSPFRIASTTGRKFSAVGCASVLM